MGILLKIAVFAVAVYTVWTAVMRWYGLLGGKRSARPAPPQAQPAPQQSRPVIEETRQCRACGTFVSLSAGKCGRPDCPLGG